MQPESRDLQKTQEKKEIQILQTKMMTPWYLINNNINNDLKIDYIQKLSRNFFNQIESLLNPIISSKTFFAHNERETCIPICDYKMIYPSQIHPNLRRSDLKSFTASSKLVQPFNNSHLILILGGFGSKT
ncbi:hypothetical protein AVEN_58906-1 [Araneus ventricosus]|uniref:Uncharacterized protein n=1 Tax=Araneus ventricosus TaxID=182803 RepID=A0A4Y2EP83_ARAVE|nr:hypothetical protein AVEN_58906-1 [Araneus ventricosus]